MRNPDIVAKESRSLAPSSKFLFQRFAHEVGFSFAESWPPSQTGDSWQSEVLKQAFVRALTTTYAENLDNSLLQEFQPSNLWVDLCLRDGPLVHIISLQVIPYGPHSRLANPIALTPLEEMFQALEPLPGLHWCFLVQYPLPSRPPLNIEPPKLSGFPKRRIYLDASHDLKISRDRIEWARVTIWFEDSGEILPALVADSLPPGRYAVDLIGLRPTYNRFPGGCGSMWMQARSELRKMQIDGEGTFQDLENLLENYRSRHDLLYDQLIVRSRPEEAEIPFVPNKWWMERVWRQILEGRFESIPYFEVIQKLTRMPDMGSRRGYLDALWSRRWNAFGTFSKCPETLSNFLYGLVFRFHSFGHSEKEET